MSIDKNDLRVIDFIEDQSQNNVLVSNNSVKNLGERNAALEYVDAFTVHLNPKAHLEIHFLSGSESMYRDKVTENLRDGKLILRYKIEDYSKANTMQLFKDAIKSNFQSLRKEANVNIEFDEFYSSLMTILDRFCEEKFSKSFESVMNEKHVFKEKIAIGSLVDGATATISGQVESKHQKFKV